MQESRYDEEGGWPESTSTGPKRKASELRRAASANVTGKKKSVASKRQGTISIDNVGSGPASKAREPVQPASLPPALQDQRDLEEQLVELDHLRTLNIEVDRERGVTQKVQGDVEMLRKQLARADEHNKSQERVRAEQAETIARLEKVRAEQSDHITKLEQVRDNQKSHIDMLV